MRMHYAHFCMKPLYEMKRGVQRVLKLFAHER